MSLADEKYVLFTTYNRNGEPVASPVWLVGLDDSRYGFWTSSGSGKAKRLAHTSKVLLQPSDGRGKVKAGTEPSECTAVLVTASDPAFGRVQQAIVAKYGVMTKITKLLNTIGGALKRKRIPYGDRAVIITVG